MTQSEAVQSKLPFGPEGGDTETRALAILLSIRGEHADRIFGGSKGYELRKTLPREPFSRVFLYESGGRGVVGCFDAKRVIHAKIEELWRKVGTTATTEERFFRYFSNWEFGYAIQVENPRRFDPPLLTPQLRSYESTFTAPQSFMLLRPGTGLYEVLDGRRECSRKQSAPLVSARRIASAERSEFRSLVLEALEGRYEEIAPTYPDTLLASHDAGRDRRGLLTKKKEVLALDGPDGKCVGFTTLTHKRGGSVKTGPTVLKSRFRSRGFGVGVRAAIERYALNAGGRRVYCTCSDQARAVIAYLLATGYRVEAHLDRHYQGVHGELVFGKRLKTGDAASVSFDRRSRDKGQVRPAESGLSQEGQRAFAMLFADTFVELPRSVVQRVCSTRPRVEGADYARKPRRFIPLHRDRRCIGVLALLPKRGGSARGLLLTESANRASLNRLLTAGEREAGALLRRKLTFLHPVEDALVLGVLRGRGYESEGVLRSPYRIGRDMMVLSRFL